MSKMFASAKDAVQAAAEVYRGTFLPDFDESPHLRGACTLIYKLYYDDGNKNQVVRDVWRDVKRAHTALATPKPDVGEAFRFTVQKEATGVVEVYTGTRIGEDRYAICGHSTIMLWEEVLQLMDEDYAVRKGHRLHEVTFPTGWKTKNG